MRLSGWICGAQYKTNPTVLESSSPVINAVKTWTMTTAKESGMDGQIDPFQCPYHINFKKNIYKVGSCIT